MARYRRQPRPDRGRGFQTAVTTLGGVALLQLVAVLWGVLSRPSHPEGASFVAAPSAFDPAAALLSGFDVVPAGEAAPPRPEESAAPLPPAARAGVARSEDTAPDLPVAAADEPLGEEGRGPLEIAPGPLAPRLPPAGEGGEIPLGEALSFALPSAAPIPDPILEGLVSAGSQHRAAGNTQRALAALREAEQVLPEHPRILGEIAATYESMGLLERAGPYWERITRLGRAGAGLYYGIAEARLRGEPVLAPALGLETASEEPPPLLRIGEVVVEEGEAGAEGQSVALRVVIDGDRDRSPQGDKLALVVFFYDLVDEVRIEASTADTSEKYPSEPYDWLDDGTEEIVVSYHQPAFTEAEQRELGNRRYYGYVIELYYEGELQDKVIMPEELASIAPPPATDREPGFPGPENALFPPGI